MPNFTIDLHAPTAPFAHYWEECVGSGHAALALRADWRAHLARCRRELGFKTVRFHGLLNDDMSVMAGAGSSPYSFYNIDSIYDFLLSIGMKPFVELSFMPETLASGSETIFHYKGNITPPNSYDDWAALVGALARHLVERYGIDEVATWNFEVWNEPNLAGFWSGGQNGYFNLYESAARAIKAVDARLRVGGPATAANAWLPEMLAFCRANDVPLDFLSTHHYPTDVALGHNLDMETSMAKSPRGTVTAMAREARRQAGDLPLYYTEWNNSPSCRDSYHDLPYGAAFVLKAVADNAGLVDMYSYWTFSDVFEELGFASTPFHGGFGLLNIHGIPKPTYHAFRLLHLLGEERLAAASSEPESTAEVLAARKAARDGGQVGVIAYNHDVPRAPIQTERVTITLAGLDGAAPARMCRVDDAHHNPRRLWQEMGSPEYLRQPQIDALLQDAELAWQPAALEAAPGGARLTFDLPPQGVVGLFIETGTA